MRRGFASSLPTILAATASIQYWQRAEKTSEKGSPVDLATLKAVCVELEGRYK